MMHFFILICILSLVYPAPIEDIIIQVPGYPSSFKTRVYSGYLDVKNENRSLHYVFVQSIKGESNTDPVTLWLNGGPGCSSLFGFLQQIGPYYLRDGVDYRLGDLLTENPYSWHKLSNLLFLESPAGVGYSINLQKNYVHNDAKTAKDNYNALVSFFKKFPQYRNNSFYMAGQSYAGKFIPDLAVQIDINNEYGGETKINLKSIIIGNGVMAISTMMKSTFQFVIDRRFIDPQIIPIYQTKCQQNLYSQECLNFQKQFSKGTEKLNPYQIYGYCAYNNSLVNSKLKNKNLKRQKNNRNSLSQQSILEMIKYNFYKRKPTVTLNSENVLNCANVDGIFNYFSSNKVPFHSSVPWNGPCASDLIYQFDPSGSINSYNHLISLASTKREIGIVLYNGNLDTVVPFTDTLKGLQILGFKQSYLLQPWFTDEQHSGFTQLFQTQNNFSLVFLTVKGGHHLVPFTKKPQAYNIFYQIISNQGLKVEQIFNQKIKQDSQMII